MSNASITSFIIYPSIGIARVGNSPDAYFFGPELPGQYPPDPQNYRDASGRIKRQAARFRVYGLDANGNVVKEITAADATISWTVQVANTKAAWYAFRQPLDIPPIISEVTGPLPPSTRRNAGIPLAQRAQLAITPPPRAITGANVNAQGGDPNYAFDKGCFFDTAVYLGEVRTDAGGRLIFLGGRGAAASRDGSPPTDTANNDGWYDDVSDGPVDAQVVYQGQTYQAKGAWVVVAPPNYAPGLQGIVTGYDLLFQVAAQMDPTLLPARPSFSEHIYPVLRRLTSMQWVNAGFARDFGFGTPNDFESPDLVGRLSDPGEGARALRQSVFELFRDAGYTHAQPAAQPAFYGDGLIFNFDAPDPREWMAVLGTQYGWLAQWAQGNFIADKQPAPQRWEDLSAADQVRLIDRGVLEDTVGGSFAPGCEFTWPMRSPLMYAEPFRIKRRTAPAPDLGDTITSANALGAGGPLDGATAGDITRWMAVPWHTDAASCLSAAISYFDDYLPTYWPARVPNDVLSTDQYNTIVDPAKPLGDKQTAFAFEQRGKLLAGVVYAQRVAFPPMMFYYLTTFQAFVQQWWQLGIIVPQPGPNGPQFPSTLWVETGRALASPLVQTADVKVYPVSQHPRFRRR